MIELGRVYEEFSNPLKEATSPEKGEIYYNTEGHKLRYLGDEEFEFVRRTELIDGEQITALDEKQLDLFWRLTKNRPKFFNSL